MPSEVVRIDQRFRQACKLSYRVQPPRLCPQTNTPTPTPTCQTIVIGPEITIVNGRCRAEKQPTVRIEDCTCEIHIQWTIKPCMTCCTTFRRQIFAFLHYSTPAEATQTKGKYCQPVPPSDRKTL